MKRETSYIGKMPGIRRRRPFALLTVIVLALLPAFSLFSESTQPNLLFVMIDTLRADHVGCYGYERGTTPSIDRLAEEGVRFDQMIASSSWTMPSLMTMFTSLPASLHGVVNQESRLGKGVTTLAEKLSEAGYETAGFISNPLAHSKFGYGRGFELYDDYSVFLAADLNLFEELEGGTGIRTLSSSPMISRRAVKWLGKKRNPDKPFFLFLLYFDPHADYTPPPPYDRRFGKSWADRDRNIGLMRKKTIFTDREKEQVVALYDGEVLFTDKHIGEVIEYLTDAGLSGNTLKIVVADHGEEFWDHGGTGHGQTLYDELVRIPCIIHWPANLPDPMVVRRQVCHADLMPTVLDAFELPVPKQCRGHSLLPLMESLDQPQRPDIVFTETEVRKMNIKAARSNKGKLIWDLQGNRKAAYDLVSDPREQDPNSPADLPEAGKLDRAIEHWWRRIVAERGPEVITRTKPAELDPQLRRAMRALGYLH